MLDIGFTELLLVAIVALVVLGPERLPGAIKVMVYWVGKMRHSFQTMKKELEREIGADEISLQLHNEAVMKELQEQERKQDEHPTTNEKAAQSCVDTDPQRGSSIEPSKLPPKE